LQLCHQRHVSRVPSSFPFFFYCYAAHRDLHSFPHDALPIWAAASPRVSRCCMVRSQRGGTFRLVMRPPHPLLPGGPECSRRHQGDRKSTRLNSSHVKISYAVFCLKKKKKTKISQRQTKYARR